jgi:hypothetical protein
VPALRSNAPAPPEYEPRPHSNGQTQHLDAHKQQNSAADRRDWYESHGEARDGGLRRGRDRMLGDSRPCSARRKRRLRDGVAIRLDDSQRGLQQRLRRVLGHTELWQRHHHRSSRRHLRGGQRSIRAGTGNPAFAGQTVRFRIAEVDNQSFLQASVDNVTITSFSAAVVGGPRLGYCAAAGDTDPFTGVALTAGSFINLAESQPTLDSNYAGATPAIYVQGLGITCDRPPAGYADQGKAASAFDVQSGWYEYWAGP